MTEPHTELKAELLAELQAELQDPKKQQPKNQETNAEDQGSATASSSQTSASDKNNDGNEEKPNEETAAPVDEEPQEKTVEDTSKEPQAEENYEPSKVPPAEVDQAGEGQPTQGCPEKRKVVVVVPEAEEAATKPLEASPAGSAIQTTQPNPAESPASTVPIVASPKTLSTTSSSESDQESTREDSSKGPENVTEAKPVQEMQSPKSSRMSSVFSPVIAKLRMDSVTTPTSSRSRRSTVSSSPSTLRTTSQVLSSLIPLSPSNSQPKVQEPERLSIVTTRTLSVQEPTVQVAELAQVPSSTTVIDFVPDQTKAPEREQRLSVATTGNSSVKDEPQSRVPSISGQTLAPEINVEPVLLKKVNTNQTSAPSSPSASPNAVTSIVKSLRQPRKRDRLRNRAFQRWILAMLFGRTIAKRLKAMLELAAGH